MYALLIAAVSVLLNRLKLRLSSFVGRPKLFFIQSCRGSEVQKGTYVDEEDDATQYEPEIHEDEADIDMISIPHKADTLIAHSTTSGRYLSIILSLAKH